MKKINYNKSKCSRFKCCTLTLYLDGVIIGEMENGWEKSKKKTAFKDVWFKGEEWGNFGKAQDFFPWAHRKMITPNRGKKGNNCFRQKRVHPNVPFLGLFVFSWWPMFLSVVCFCHLLPFVFSFFFLMLLLILFFFFFFFFHPFFFSHLIWIFVLFKKKKKI